MPSGLPLMSKPDARSSTLPVGVTVPPDNSIPTASRLRAWSPLPESHTQRSLSPGGGGSVSSPRSIVRWTGSPSSESRLGSTSCTWPVINSLSATTMGSERAPDGPSGVAAGLESACRLGSSLVWSSLFTAASIT
eukprot:scaffold13751_cov108-Isochrysis_galbana.AAC.14